MATQATVNSKLAESVNSPILAAFISFAVGTIALFVYILLTGVPLTDLASAKNAAPVAWIGGFLGAFFVVGNGNDCAAHRRRARVQSGDWRTDAHSYTD